MKAVNCHLSMSGSEWSLESPDSFLPKKMRGGRTREEEDVIGLAMHDLQRGVVKYGEGWGSRVGLGRGALICYERAPLHSCTGGSHNSTKWCGPLSSRAGTLKRAIAEYRQ